MININKIYEHVTGKECPVKFVIVAHVICAAEEETTGSKPFLLIISCSERIDISLYFTRKEYLREFLDLFEKQLHACLYPSQICYVDEKGKITEC